MRKILYITFGLLIASVLVVTPVLSNGFSVFENEVIKTLDKYCNRKIVKGQRAIFCYFYDLLTDHETRIGNLEEAIVAPGTLPPPAFDSGWITFAGKSSVIDVAHDVGGDINDYFIYVIYRRPNGSFMSHQTAANKVWWEDVELNNIQVVRNGDVSNLFDAFRVRIWRLENSE